MLDNNGIFLYIYVVARDFGFAPNPFHGFCTLATCKPDIRKVAKIGDWIMGVGGSRLKATGRCLYLMEVTETSTFNDYWADNRFEIKKPQRNGSLVMMVGDNIYHRNADSESWTQEDSHHSNSDGTTHEQNLKTDTRSVNVLISNHFYYFGSSAPLIDIASIGYKNVRNYRKFSFNDSAVSTLVKKIQSEHWKDRNRIIADPYDFVRAAERVDQSTGRIS